MDKKIRVLLGQPSLENHSRGIITVANMLRVSGMEVIYIGNCLPEQIIEAAVQEDVDVIGISILCGAELVYGKDLMRFAREKELMGKVVFLLGGIFPPQHKKELKDMGFNGIFGPGAGREEISSLIRQAVSSK